MSQDEKPKKRTSQDVADAFRFSMQNMGGGRGLGKTNFMAMLDPDTYNKLLTQRMARMEMPPVPENSRNTSGDLKVTDEEYTSMRGKIEKVEAWHKWSDLIPYITWPSHWLIKPVPPTEYCLVRYRVTTKNLEEHGLHVSVWFDPYKRLSPCDYVYWGVSPDKVGNIGKWKMDEQAQMMEDVENGLKFLARRLLLGGEGSGAFEPNPSYIKHRVTEFLITGRKIGAVEHVRHLLNIGLREAKDYVDKIESELHGTILGSSQREVIKYNNNHYIELMNKPDWTRAVVDYMAQFNCSSEEALKCLKNLDRRDIGGDSNGGEPPF